MYRNESSPNGCTICNQNYELGQVVRKMTNCPHFFHQQCIDIWFASNSTCPICRRNLNNRDNSNSNQNNITNTNNESTNVGEIENDSQQDELLLTEEDEIENLQSDLSETGSISDEYISPSIRRRRRNRN